MWNTRGLRGSAFEELIDLTNQLYMKKGIAVIQKVPTPITPIAVDNKAHTITLAYFGKKSTVDFLGVSRGVALCFDAKETKETNFPLKNIHLHQIEFMEMFRLHGGMSFLLVNFATKDEIFLLPSENLQRHYKASQEGGRKSIAYKDFDHALRISGSDGIPINYLKTAFAFFSNCSTI